VLCTGYRHLTREERCPELDFGRLRGPLRPALPGQDVPVFARREQVGLRVVLLPRLLDEDLAELPGWSTYNSVVPVPTWRRTRWRTFLPSRTDLTIWTNVRSPLFFVRMNMGGIVTGSNRPVRRKMNLQHYIGVPGERTHENKGFAAHRRTETSEIENGLETSRGVSDTARWAFMRRNTVATASGLHLSAIDNADAPRFSADRRANHSVA